MLFICKTDLYIQDVIQHFEYYGLQVTATMVRPQSLLIWVKRHNILGDPLVLNDLPFHFTKIDTLSCHITL
jgi:hypothetical protein